MKYLTLIQWHKALTVDGVETLEWHNPGDEPMELPILDEREIVELIEAGTITPDYAPTSTVDLNESQHHDDDTREVG